MKKSKINQLTKEIRNNYYLLETNKDKLIALLNDDAQLTELAINNYYSFKMLEYQVSKGCINLHNENGKIIPKNY